jgi:nucleoside-diphosphate-sugar epimerase
MAKVIVTGGSGFIGTNLVEFYLSAGHEVFNLDILPPRNSNHIAHWVKVDIADKEAISILIKEIKPSLIFHFAARTDLNGKSLSDYDANIKGVQNIIDAINKVKTVKLTVFASSMLVCKLGYQPIDNFDYCPNTIYGESKAIGEKIVRDSSLKTPWVIVRPTSMWGPWFDIPYKSFFDAINKGLYFHPAGLRVRRSYGFVLNAVYQLFKISEMNDESILYETLYLADYKPIELKEWSEMIKIDLNANPIRELPLKLFQFLAIIGDILKLFGIKNPPMSSFRLNNMQTETILNIDKLEKYAGECPYTLEEGVLMTCKWLKENE